MLLLHATLFPFYNSISANFFSSPLNKPVESMKKGVCVCGVFATPVQKILLSAAAHETPRLRYGANTGKAHLKSVDLEKAV